MSRLKLLAAVILCVGLSGIPVIGNAHGDRDRNEHRWNMPHKTPTVTPAGVPNGIRVSYSLSNAASPPIDVPPNVPVLVMGSVTGPGSGFGAGQALLTSLPSQNVMVWTGFQNPFVFGATPPATSGKSNNPGDNIVFIDSRGCVQVEVVSATQILVREVCAIQSEGTVTLIY